MITKHMAQVFSVVVVIVVLFVPRAFSHGEHSSVTKATSTTHNEVTVPTNTSDYKFFIREIFRKYGVEGKLSFEGFEHLMVNLGLGNIKIEDHNITSHKTNHKFRHMHDTHDHSKAASGGPIAEKHATTSTTTTTPSGVEDHHHWTSDDAAVQGCMSPKQMLQIIRMNTNGTMDDDLFLLVCPIMIWELEQQFCLHPDDREDVEGDDHDHDVHNIYKWIYSSFAVLMISLCGLFSVAVIPVMQKWFYQTLLQFLVGLAVGTLSGDALLHLLPHAMISGKGSHGHGHGHGDGADGHDHLEAMWRGMTALGGIVFFFLAERLLNALSAYRRRKNLKSSVLSASKPSTPVPDAEDYVCVGEKLSHYRKNSYGVKMGPDGKETMQMLPTAEDLPPRRDSRHSSIHEVAFHGRSSFSADPHNGPLYHPVPRGSNPDNYMVTVTEHHGHGHGHSHEVPESVSAVAWMVIMGDGLHNFCDGMAIGAAFASGIAGGISTTVAVFCHELPHELGDFAMLLKTGMKVKQALFYNGLSSVLCFIGMFIGLPLGTVESANSWIFALTAGMFLYIALVDMLPELSVPSIDPSSTPTYALAVQVLGISTGVSIMLIIAMFEEELRQIAS